jgi:MFS family permease
MVLLHVQGLMCIGHLVMASAATGSLYVGSIIMGVCYGAQWSLMPATTSELFGLRRFGTLYNTITIASPVAAYVLSVRVAGYFYDKEAKRQHELTTLITWLPSVTSTGSEDPLLCAHLGVRYAFGCFHEQNDSMLKFTKGCIRLSSLKTRKLYPLQVL